MVLVQKELKNAYIGEYVEWWQPWANTVAYYPLEEDVLDHSWNNRNLTNNNITFWQKDWVTAALFNGTDAYASLWSQLSLGDTFTILAWYWHNAWNNGMVYCQWASASLYPSLWLWYWINSSNVSVHSWTGGNNTWLTSTVGSNNWKWVLWVFVFDNGSVSLYENNVVTKTWTLSAPWTWWEWFYVGMRRNPYHFFWWAINKLILENKVRTAQERTDYYNQTKSLYGIS